MLETALKNMFDYQRFEQNPSLQDVIDQVLERYSQNRLLSLSDDDLALAAGGVRMAEETKQEPNDDGHGTV